VLSLAEGKELWKFETARPVSAPVAIGRGVLVLGDAGGTVYCLEAQAP
jgi:outer membrane protein assembly factor BamB